MKSIFLLIGLTILLCCCKKEENPAPSSTGNTTTTPPPNNATSWYGILTWSGTQMEMGGSVNPINYSYRAFFANSAVPAVAPSYSVTVDSVKVNNNLCYLSGYYYTMGSLGSTSATWQVYGNNGIPNFSFTNTNAMPTYTGYNSLPDSVSKSQSLTISVNGISGYDKATVMIYDGSNVYSQPLGAGANSVTFSAGTMANLNTTNSGTIWIDLQKNNVNAFSGKDFNFVNDFQFSKYVKIY